MGSRTSIKRDGGTAENYGYDLAQEVTTGIENGAATTYGYDANGNRTALNSGGSYVTNSLNQQTTFNGQTVGPDPKGNVASYGSTATYVYDAQNRLRNVTTGGVTSVFKYDGLNRKISQTIGGVTTYNVWDGWNLIEERNASNVLLQTYLYGAGEIIERITGTTQRFYFQDGLGSTSHFAEESGILLESYKYGTFGQQTVYAPNGTVRTTGTAYDIRHLYTGQLWMPQAGLYDYRNRAYSPTLTRFLQPDPIGFGGDPTNLYRYCGNNPVNGSDPLGLDDKKRQRETGDPPGGEATTDRVTVNGSYDFDNRPNGFRQVTDRNGGIGFLNQGGGRNNGIGGTGITFSRNSNKLGTSPGAPRSTQGNWTHQDGLPTGDSWVLELSDAKLFAELQQSFLEANALAKWALLSPAFYWEEMFHLDTSFWNGYGATSTYSYYGYFDAMHRLWTNWEINYIAVGEGFAAGGFNIPQMNSIIAAWNTQYQSQGINTYLSGKMAWAAVGYDYYLHSVGH